MSKKKLSILVVTIFVSILAIGITACSAPQAAAAASPREQGQEYMGGKWGTSVDNPSSVSGSGPVHSEEYVFQQGEYQGWESANSQGNQGGGQGQQAGRGRNSEQGQGQANGGQGQGRGQSGQGQGAGNGSGGGMEPLSEAEIEALIRAIEEELGAQAIYQSVLDTFGDVVPFNSIVNSEAQHAAALIRMAEKYDVPVPEFPDASELPTFDTLEEACQAGVDAEIADAQLYDELMPLTNHEDLLRVYTNLQDASLNNHLSEFESCQ